MPAGETRLIIEVAGFYLVIAELLCMIKYRDYYTMATGYKMSCTAQLTMPSLQRQTPAQIYLVPRPSHEEP
ncbi:hypothetical protein BDQ94DRAFT_148103 [Aspergillus welwitschiae]|uniref:Uncharacterized protein n=1 Tax=Aspergillus welwitschiae TaxID=1341132 RepID=A0A3F3PVB1_9EURO|nr:hypothetical protein BDQ94DRAFT_148103 [Aspergillus welwitschiae]RDH30863.1 hypothetical protein BDQ94DRAFT_148103 [Aspergillus welwitschiae]